MPLFAPRIIRDDGFTWTSSQPSLRGGSLAPIAEEIAAEILPATRKILDGISPGVSTFASVVIATGIFGAAFIPSGYSKPEAAAKPVLQATLVKAEKKAAGPVQVKMLNVSTAAPVILHEPVKAVAPVTRQIIYFDSNIQIAKSSRPLLDKMAAAMKEPKACPHYIITGHADQTGTLKSNQAISVRRARTIAGELVKRGVPAQKLSTQGFGANRPLPGLNVASNQHRRVQIACG